MPPAKPTIRARRADALRKQREQKAERRATLLDLVVAGYSHEQIADRLKMPIRTVRREVERSLDARPVEAPGRYVALQRLRIDKALRAADQALEDGEPGAVRAFVAVMAAMDRYHSLSLGAAASQRPPDDSQALEIGSSAPKLAALPGPGGSAAGTPLRYSFTLRNLSALPITHTDDSDIAAAAMTGDSSQPKAGYSTPAAIGTPAAL